MMLTRRSVTVGSAALAASALVLGPEAIAAPRRRRKKTSAEGGQAVLDWELITFRTVYPTPLYPTIPIPVGLPILGFVSLTMYRAAQRSAHLGASSESAAVARAAHDVLAHYVPEATTLDADLAATFAAIGPGHARNKGDRIGAEAARDCPGQPRRGRLAEPGHPLHQARGTRCVVAEPPARRTWPRHGWARCDRCSSRWSRRAVPTR